MKNTLTAIAFLLVFVNISYSQQNCANALEITFDDYSTCGQIAITNANLTDAVPSIDLPSPECGNFDASTNDLWYFITVPDGVTELAFHVMNAPTPMPLDEYHHQPGLAIYSGECGNLTLLNCFYEEGNFINNGEIRFEIISGLTPGEVLFLRVWDMNNFAVPFFIAASVRTEIPEHSCETPALLSDGGCNILAPKGTIDAPGDCGWNISDNTIYYYFVVNSEDPQPTTIEANYVFCFPNEGGPITTENTELQMAVYKWNGSDCSWIGGSPNTGNDSTYIACQNGVGSITLEENLEPGLYMVAFDGYSMISGTSLCTFEFASNFSNEIICPNDTTICTGTAPLLLDQAQPIGGTYMCTNHPAAIINGFFDTEVTTGPNYIIYSLNTFTCNYTINVPFLPNTVPNLGICLVTVNDDNKNKILWEKPISDSIDYFTIYKEDGGNFYPIGSVNYEDESSFVDINSEPQIQAYKYKISWVSLCNIECELSDFHQTVLLEMTEQTDSWYLSWTPYIGIDDFSVNVLRGTAPDNLEIIASFDNTVTEYTDNDPPSGYVYYQIEVVLSTPCDVSKTISQLYSNIATNDPDYYLTIDSDEYVLTNSIFPNPATNYFTIKSENTPANVQVFDLNGKLVKSINNYSGENIDITDLQGGIYFVKLITGDKISVGKLVVE